MGVVVKRYQTEQGSGNSQHRKRCFTHHHRSPRRIQDAVPGRHEELTMRKLNIVTAWTFAVFLRRARALAPGAPGAAAEVQHLHEATALAAPLAGKLFSPHRSSCRDSPPAATQKEQTPPVRIIAILFYNYPCGQLGDVSLADH